MDPAGLRRLLIPVSPEIRVLEDRRSAGIHILASQWVVDGRQRPFVDVVCLKPHLNDLFDIIVFEILSELKLGAQPPAQVCAEVLERWRELFTFERGTLPSRDAIIGLWGELWVLQQLAALSPAASRAWTGPQGARFDFNSRTVAIEVKTTVQRHGLSVFIHGHDQLEVPAGLTLNLAVVRIEEIPTGGQSLPSAVDALVQAGLGRPALMLVLAKLGFTPDVVAACGAIEFRLLEDRFYRVDDAFPKIVSSSFAGGRLPPGIVTLTYQLDLTGVPPHPLSTSDTNRLMQTIIAELDE
ncbi:MAG: PD-(D/E)XK motif protein [Anaerolineales bacterium]|nr:PD-(D/E)XK motif protein [Anaerolineales bacterium]